MIDIRGRDSDIFNVEYRGAAIHGETIHCSVRVEERVHVGGAGARSQLACAAKAKISGRYQPST
jgi:hypothetical protein